MTSNDLQALEPTETAGDDRAQDEGKEAAELAENQSQSSRDGQDSAIEPDKGTATNYLRGWRLLVTTVAYDSLVSSAQLKKPIWLTMLQAWLCCLSGDSGSLYSRNLAHLHRRCLRQPQ